MLRRNRIKTIRKSTIVFHRILDTVMGIRKRTRLIILGSAGVLLVALILVIALPKDTEAMVQQAGIADAVAPVTDTGSDTSDAIAQIEPIPTPLPTPTPTPDPTLQKGDENERVQQLQNRLMDYGYMDLDESTQLYGPATKYAVKLFQRQHDVQQDGIAGPQTLDLIYSDEAKHYTLLEGTKGRDVDSLQRQLIDLGYLAKSTGYYGTETVASVKAFQERNGLDTDGKTGPLTLDLLYSPNAKESASKVMTERRRANVSTMLDVAAKQLGDPYILGNEGPKSFDCSGLVYYCLRQAGSSRGRYNAAGYSQVSDWDKITSMNDLEKGDLLFFWSSSKSKVGHVGIYIGSGMMIDASSSNGKVVKRSCTTSYWKRMFVCARRPW